MNAGAAYCVSTALNVKKLIFFRHMGNIIAFYCCTRPFSLTPNNPFDECGCWEHRAFKKKRKEDQSCRGFRCVGREEEECMNPTTTSSLPRPFITQLAEGKGNWKVCSGSSADRRQTTRQASRSCFVGQLVCFSRLHESLRLPAVISEQSCIYNWMVIGKTKNTKN